ncbi:DNA translocase FtsK [Rhizobium sp. Root482]|uniref:DNA translocase FtsK n=1 Tax=Rhizobium sp. Root482 TaxID=1736543 RepID=UPI0009EC57EA
MRLSRTNFPNGLDMTEEEPAYGDQPLEKADIQRSVYGAHPVSVNEESMSGVSTDAIAASEIEGRKDAPVWQSAFVLGPNVRFTRTPESVISKKSMPAARQEKGQPVAPLKVDPVGIDVTGITDMTTPASAVPPGIQNAPVGGIRLLSLRLQREMEMRAAEPSAVASNETADIDLACFPADGEIVSAAVTEPGFRRAAPFLHVSDEVFWDTLHMEADLDVLAPTLRWQPPEYQVASNSVTSLYREVGVRPVGKTSVAPPVSISVPAAQPQKPPRAAVAEEVPAPSRPLERREKPAPAGVSARPVTARLIETIGAIEAGDDYVHPPVDLLQEPSIQQTAILSQEALEQSAGLLESVLEDFGIRGEIIDVRPGPVVTLYEFEPAPGVKSSRVIGLSDDIARSMSALSARVAVVPGRNVIGIELPNPVRETVYFRELIESENYVETRLKLALCLGKTIGGEPVVAELAKMPHLLVAGTTGSGKSVAINTMILSLLYRLKPEECRLIMVDPKMLELSVYDGIPHLLTPVVTDPKKAVMALKWAVREMEDRYRKMSRLGVRNIDGYNARAATARAKGETVLCSVQTGFDRSTGEAIFEQEEMDLAPMPYIVIIVDEMADLMMVAGKEIEGAIQRLAQMARAAGIHLIMATQRPSVDVITGTIKANFPTRISFQVTSKIDSRTILGEQGAEHLLGQGDMLHMVGGGRIARVHGPFVSDEEVEKVVAHLKTQGRPEYLGTVTEDADEVDEPAEEDSAVFDKGAMAEEDGNDLYDKAVKVVLRDKKCSTSYIQRRLSIGYNRAASLVERMEREGLVGPANHVGKRSILSAVGRETVDIPMGDAED